MVNRLLGILAAGLCLFSGSLLSACADPGSVVAFDAPDPAARLRAARQAVVARDASAVPALINMLGSEDPAERLIAIRSLEDLTGQTLGYDHADSASERGAAAQRWAVWYAEHRATSPPRSRSTLNAAS